MKLALRPLLLAAFLVTLAFPWLTVVGCGRQQEQPPPPQTVVPGAALVGDLVLGGRSLAWPVAAAAVVAGCAAGVVARRRKGAGARLLVDAAGCVCAVVGCAGVVYGAWLYAFLSGARKIHAAAYAGVGVLCAIVVDSVVAVARSYRGWCDARGPVTTTIAPP